MDIFTILTLTVIVFDVALGLILAWVNDSFVSKKARRGIMEHLVISTIIIIANYFCNEFHTEGLFNMIQVFLSLSYGVSIVKNLKLLGVPIPDWLTTKLEAELASSNKGEENDIKSN